MFQLKHRLARLKVSQPDNAFTQDALSPGHSTDLAQGSIAHTGDEDILVEATGLCTGKSDVGNKAPRARFGRRRTHNEELCVASCGVILGRATFYGSEAPNGVRVSYNCSV